MGSITAGGSISTAQQTAAFLILQQMWAGWSTEQDMSNAVYHQAFTLTAGQNAYTLGTAGTLVATANPLRVTAATSTSGAFRNPVTVVSFDKFDQLVADGTGKTSVLAELVAVDNSYPTKNIRVYPTPAASPGSLTLEYFAQLAQFATVGDSLNLAPGYEEALHYNLAVALYPQYRRAAGIPPELAILAENSKRRIMDLNRSILGLQQAAQTPAVA
jgi:hypothetical protein